MSQKVELLDFQARASRQIADRYQLLLADPDRPTFSARRPVPYFQALKAITGAGKTAILADAITQIALVSVPKPVVLWTTRLRVVLEQSMLNMDVGGKYSEIVQDFGVVPISRLDRDMLADGGKPILAMATTGTFNEEDRESGRLSVHRIRQDDDGDESLWSALTKRDTAQGRRPLIVVYDEGHNITDQQTDVLMELEPDAILVASATLTMPGRLGRAVQRLVEDGWDNSARTDGEDVNGDPLLDQEGQPVVQRSLITQVPSALVVANDLVKGTVEIGGYESAMEPMLDEMLGLMRQAEQAASEEDAGFLPKVIYVCQTNINVEDGSPDVAHKPFRERMAPPIRIWRYLTEHKGVPSEEIAVYCNLETSDTHPLPDDFILFRGGDRDYSKLVSGNYRHIIFNQRLQEGWDDPACCFAYIDKTMQSATQIKQIIGRVLRQPNLRKYKEPLLNTASFFVRLDDNQEFPAILQSVKAELGVNIPTLIVRGHTDPGGRRKAREEVKPEMAHYSVPHVHIDSDGAVEPMLDALAALADYRLAPALTQGPGQVQVARVDVETAAAGAVIFAQRPNSARVRARWLVRREMKQVYGPAVAVVPWNDQKLNVPVEIRSEAATRLKELGLDLVEKFLEGSDLVVEPSNPYQPGAINVSDAAENFIHAVHSRYDLKPFEGDVARQLDALGVPWARNPEVGGFSIPLLTRGKTKRFFPDFLVWKNDKIYAIDPKGAHLIPSDTRRKLFDIKPERRGPQIVVRFITTGRWTDNVEQETAHGFTLFASRTGGFRARHFATLPQAVRAAVG